MNVEERAIGMKIGQQAPNFELTDLDGNSRSLAEFKGHSHVLLVLNRGLI